MRCHPFCSLAPPFPVPHRPLHPPTPHPLLQILMGGTAVWQRRDVVIGGNLSTEFKLPKSGGRGGKSDTLCSMNAQLNNKGNGQVGGGRAAGPRCSPACWLYHVASC